MFTIEGQNSTERDFKEVFIDIVKKYPIIWNYSLHTTYNVFQDRRAAFAEVAGILSDDKSKYTGLEMQYTWCRLRNKFRDVLKKVLSNGGNDDNVTWRHWRRLQFITDYECEKINKSQSMLKLTNKIPLSFHVEPNTEIVSDDNTNSCENSEQHRISRQDNNFNANLNSITIDLSCLAIFPDEEDKGIKRLNDCTGVKTRSTKYRNHLQMKCQLSQIDDWKKRSGYFTNCAQKDICDPFGIFDENEENICFSCLETRDNIREKAILMWDSEKLQQELCDYAYFHAVKIFNSNAEYLFANSESKHPFFLSYEHVRQQVKIILKNLISIFNFPTDMQVAARRAFMSETRNEKDMKVSPYCIICCETIIGSSYVLSFEGCRYKNNFELIGNDDLKPNNFFVCYYHAKIFTVYYRLLHMDWNIHWNCYLRLSQTQKRLPNLNSFNVINSIDPQIFLHISNEYFSLFKMLDDLVYKGNSVKISTTFTESLFNWNKIKDHIKDMGILKRMERKQI